jgi:hypothetical protein
MEIKLFTDLINALDKVVKGLKAIADQPREERDMYRATLDETFQLIDAALSMVIIRLGDVALKEGGDFIDEVYRLESFDGWIETERSFRICMSLRSALDETQRARTRLAGQISVADWDRLIDHMDQILRTEGELANFISRSLDKLARYPDKSGVSEQDVRNKVRAFRAALIKERQRLIRQEIKLYEII